MSRGSGLKREHLPFTSPAKSYCVSRRVIDPDEFDREAICSTIFQLYKDRENLVLKKLVVRMSIGGLCTLIFLYLCFFTGDST